MFVDAVAIVAVLSGEPESRRCVAALDMADNPITSAIALWEAAVALARADKLNLPIDATEQMVRRLLEERGIELRDFPPAGHAASLAVEAARRFRSGRSRLNLADCFHYACARHYGVPILSTADEFRFTDIETIR